jgi:hypothetical protein
VLAVERHPRPAEGLRLDEDWPPRTCQQAVACHSNSHNIHTRSRVWKEATVSRLPKPDTCPRFTAQIDIQDTSCTYCAKFAMLQKQHGPALPGCDHPLFWPCTCHALRSSSDISEDAIEWRFDGACLRQRVTQSALCAPAPPQRPQEAIALQSATRSPSSVGWAAAHIMPDMMQYLLAAGTHLDGGNIANQLRAWLVKTVLALCTGRHEDASLAAAAAAGIPADISKC